jgi:hypothetical protein
MLFKRKYRILQNIYLDGRGEYIPQTSIFGIFWNGFNVYRGLGNEILYTSIQDNPTSAVKFKTYDEAEEVIKFSNVLATAVWPVN